MKISTTLLVAASFGLVAACGQDDANQSISDSSLGPGSVATIAGEAIPESLFRYFSLNSLQKDPDALTEVERTQLIEELIRFKLLAKAGEEHGLHEERTIAAELELARLQLMARAMALRFIEENPATESELRAMYEANLPRLASDQYKARHILVDAEDEAQRIIAELDNGADFEALARERSTGPTGPSGGDLGWFSADTMVQPFADAVRAMQVDTYSSEPVQTRFGWHVILVEDIRESQPPGLNTVRTELTTSVEREKLENYVIGLRNAVEVDIEFK